MISQLLFDRCGILWFFVTGDGKMGLTMESSSLVILNNLLAKVSYTSTVYHIHTGDLGMDWK